MDIKSIIIYYSYSGNTHKVANILAEDLRRSSQVDILRLQALDESDSFFAQALRALKHSRGKIKEAKLDLSGYDRICLGTPVWAFAPVPAVNTYLDQCSGIEGKDVIIFTTYGSGTGNTRCLNYMQRALSQKGAKGFRRFSIQQFKAKDKEFILSEVQKITSLSFDST